MKIIAALVILFGVVTGLVYADSRLSNEPTVKRIQPEADYLTGDVWTCLQRIGVIDRNNFKSTEIPDHADDTLIWVYKVTNIQRDETRAVTVEYGYDDTGSSVMVNCWPPNEWMNWEIAPTITPYVLPAEATNEGTPQS